MRIFPQEFIDHSIEHYTFRIATASQSIYIAVVCTVLFGIALMPFIRADVTINARGQVTSADQRHTVVLPIGGKVMFTSIAENREVDQGDTLVVLDNHTLLSEYLRDSLKVNELESFIQDLRRLIKKFPRLKNTLSTPRFQLEYEQQLTEYLHLSELASNRKKTYDRQSQLLWSNAISQVEFEASDLDFKEASNSKRLFLSQLKSRWQLELQSITDQSAIIYNEQIARIEKMNLFVVTAPVSGTLQNVLGIKAGQFFHTGSRIAEISPVNNLVAICFIPPQRIGLVEVGQSVSMRIDAYNSTQWGILTGTVEEISNDVYYQEGQGSFFKVKCRLANDYLKLKTGVRGKIKRGMTLTANLKIAERTLFQLLYDKTDNWLSPYRID